MNTLLVETSPSALKGKDGRWSAVFLTSGQGSSGKYSDDLLREYGPTAIAPGAKCFITHNRRENGEPDPRDMWGFIPDGARYEESGKLVGEIEVLPHYKELVETLAPHTKLSIYVMGESDSDGNVTKLLPAVDNGVDLVVHGGRPGSELVEKLYESARNAFVEASVKAENGTATADRKTQSEGFSDMEIVELAAKVDALTESITALVGGFATLAESIKPIETVIEEESLASVAEAAIRAGLPEESRKVVYEAVKGGTKSEDAIAAQKALVESIKASLIAPVVTVGDGRVVEGASTRFSLKKMVEVA